MGWPAVAGWTLGSMLIPPAVDWLGNRFGAWDTESEMQPVADPSSLSGAMPMPMSGAAMDALADEGLRPSARGSELTMGIPEMGDTPPMQFRNSGGIDPYLGAAAAGAAVGGAMIPFSRGGAMVPWTPPALPPPQPSALTQPTAALPPPRSAGGSGPTISPSRAPTTGPASFRVPPPQATPPPISPSHRAGGSAAARSTHRWNYAPASAAATSAPAAASAPAATSRMGALGNWMANTFWKNRGGWGKVGMASLPIAALAVIAGRLGYGPLSGLGSGGGGGDEAPRPPPGATASPEQIRAVLDEIGRSRTQSPTAQHYANLLGGYGM